MRAILIPRVAPGANNVLALRAKNYRTISTACISHFLLPLMNRLFDELELSVPVWIIH